MTANQRCIFVSLINNIYDNESNTTEQGQFSDPVSTDWSVLSDTLDADLGTGKDYGIR